MSIRPSPSFCCLGRMPRDGGDRRGSRCGHALRGPPHSALLTPTGGRGGRGRILRELRVRLAHSTFIVHRSSSEPFRSRRGHSRVIMHPFGCSRASCHVWQWAGPCAVRHRISGTARAGGMSLAQRNMGDLGRESTRRPASSGAQHAGSVTRAPRDGKIT